MRALASPSTPSQTIAARGRLRAGTLPFREKRWLATEEPQPAFAGVHVSVRTAKTLNVSNLPQAYLQRANDQRLPHVDGGDATG